MLLHAIQYHKLCLLKQHTMLTITYSLTRNLLFQICFNVDVFFISKNLKYHQTDF